ncbi:MAG: Gfo/Idh/MocA family oxidoreductase [Cyclobacteriaceae bacterium]|nr:Gfo/Idh/MocA family oxidoreductase [Cyclobacteriaceae bacterium]
MLKIKHSRRKFIGNAALAFAGISIVPRHVLGKGMVAPSDKLNIGFIGTGRQSAGLGGSFLGLDQVNIVAASDIYHAKMDIFEKMVNSYYQKKNNSNDWKGFKTYHNYREILERADINAVVIVTPDHWHALPAIEAANAGKHIYCEKPLSHTVAEGRAMVKAARNNGITFQTGSMQRSWKDFRHACELVSNGYIGEVQRVVVSVGDPALPCHLQVDEKPDDFDWEKWVGPAPIRGFSNVLAPPPSDQGWPMWRAYREYGGGILCDWGAHMFDIAQWALGMDNSGPVNYIVPKEANTTRGLKMIYGNGIEMVHEDFGRGWGVQFFGTEGQLNVSRDYLDSNPKNIVKEKIKDSDKRLYLSDNHYQNFVDCIKSGERPVCDVEIGHRSASVCNLANIAYQLHTDLEWDPVAEVFIGNKAANALLTKQYRKGYEIPV